jgi:hypothetical protein
MRRQTYQFHPEIASALDVPQAILMEFIGYCLEMNMDKEQNYTDGHYWVWYTLKQFCTRFPFWSKGQIETILKKLLDNDIIIKSNHNKQKNNQTCWYTFTIKGWEIYNQEPAEPAIDASSRNQEMEDAPVLNSPDISSSDIQEVDFLKSGNGVPEIRKCEQFNNHITQPFNTPKAPVCVQKSFEKKEKNPQADAYASEFQAFQDYYPKATDKRAKAAYVQARKDGASYEDINAGAFAYSESRRKAKLKPVYALKASDWIESKGWEEFVNATPKTLSHVEQIKARPTCRHIVTKELYSTSAIQYVPESSEFILPDGQQVPEQYIQCA